MRKKLLLLNLIFFHFFALAQEDAWVYLSDKQNVAQSIANPISILTQKSIDRKNAQGIPIDERDVPVNEAYISQLKQATGITVLAKSKWFNAVHVRGSEADVNALSVLSFVQSIEFAGPTGINSRPSNMPINKFEQEDTRITYSYGSTQNQVEMIGADYLHEQNFTGENVLVAILDAGFPGVNTIDAFLRLRNNGDLLNGYDFVNRTTDVYAYTGNTHGTRVLSTMAAYIENQFVGTAPDASYYLFRTEDAASETPVEESYWVEAAERADSLGVDVINTSLGYKDYDNSNYSHFSTDLDGYTTYITRGANIAFEKGILLVNSAGNSGANGVNAPADSPFVVSVGSVDSSGNYSAFSSQGSVIQPSQKPNVVARGSGAYVVDQVNAIGQNNGTSLSSPILAGALVCFKQAFPNMSNQELINIMHQSSSQYLTPDYFLGYGIPDFEMAFGLLSKKDINNTTIKVYPNPIKDRLYVSLSSTNQNALLILYNVIGKEVLRTKLSTNTSQINVSHLPQGLYVVMLKTNNHTQTYKLIKE